MGADEVGLAPADGGDDAGANTGANTTDQIAFVNLGRQHPDMERRMRDMGFCHLLMDAKESGGEVSLIGRDLFRVGEERPLVDEIHMSDGDIPMALLRGDG